MTVYRSRPTNRRPRLRLTRTEVEERRAKLMEIVAAGQPMTLRQVFYQATVLGVVEKSETGYKRVQADLTLLRKNGELPYHWLADNTRWQRRPQTYSSVEQALRDTSAFYRKSLWDSADAYVEIWLEKDALSGVVYPITEMYDVPLMVARGYASLSFLYSAAEAINELNVPAYIYHFGDFDPSGVNAGEHIEDTLMELAPDAEIIFKRVAVTERQIEDWDLTTRPTKQSDSRAARFGSDISVELDAIEPNRLRNLVRKTIEKHLPMRQFEILKAAEQSEREIISRLVSSIAPDKEEE
jgi:hypothetical protein